MKKPTEAIERMRGLYGSGHLWDDSVKIVLSYLDSMPEWPADLTRERLEELADQTRSFAGPCNALRRLAAIAPKREKRKVEIWENADTGARTWAAIGAMLPVIAWRKVGEAEIDA